MHGLHLLMLWCFAVAQPLFDLLSAEPAFFVARRSQPLDVSSLTLFLTILAPLPLLLLSLATWLAGRLVHRLIHGVLVAALLTLILLPPLNRSLASSGWTPALLAGFGGLAGTWLYSRLAVIRQYATWLLPAMVIFPALFLLDVGVRRIAFPAKPTVDPVAASTSATPLVLVIVDELPLISLLNEEGRIDPVRYPNFADLADHATWYPNATVTADYTAFSVPAMLTGRYPDRKLLPLALDHPRNLFTLLASSHDLQVMETFTWLCPPSLCRGERPGFPVRFRTLISDLAVVYLHLVLPRPMRESLPPIVQNWQDIGQPERPTKKQLRARNRERFAADRGARFLRFVESIRRGSRPSFVYLHTSLPHAPWTLLPSGTRYPSYGEPAWGERGFWTADEAVVLESYRRHLLQVGYVDVLLGALFDRLREVALYDPALMVVTSDHGMSFRPGGERRKLTDTNLSEILSVPLIVKAPFQTEAIVDERSFPAIDLLPTMADHLGVEVPWEMHGTSIRNPATARRRPVVAYRTAPALWEEVVVQPEDLEQRSRGLEKKLGLFGSGDASLASLAPAGLEQLIGRATRTLEITEASDVRLELPMPSAAFDVQQGLDLAPIRLAGTASRASGSEGPLYLAVAVNGVVRAATRVREEPDPRDRAFFSFLLEESPFVPGRNRVEFFVTDPRGEPFLLRRVDAVFSDS